VAKIFRGKDIHLLLKQIRMIFSEVYCAKPKASRNSSLEAFVVAKGFVGVAKVGLAKEELNSWDLISTLNHLKTFEEEYEGTVEDNLEEMIPFVACGEETDFDPDVNYPLSTKVVEGGKEYAYLEPRQKPIDPPYQQFLDKRNKIHEES